MKILVLNGSPRPNGNTAEMVSVFQDAAESNGHTVKIFNVCKMNIKGCMACEYCHGAFTNHDVEVAEKIREMAASL